MKKLVLTTILLLCLIACTDSSSDGSDVSDSRLDDRDFRTDCGVVADGILRNPIRANRGRLGAVEILSSNTLIFRTAGSDQLVRLHGLAPDPANNAAIIELLEERTLNTTSLLVEPIDDGCNTQVNGEPAIVANVLTTNGRSLAELISREGFGTPETTASCRADLVAPCYRALRDVALN